MPQTPKISALTLGRRSVLRAAFFLSLFGLPWAARALDGGLSLARLAVEVPLVLALGLVLGAAFVCYEAAAARWQLGPTQATAGALGVAAVCVPFALSQAAYASGIATTGSFAEGFRWALRMLETLPTRNALIVVGGLVAWFVPPTALRVAAVPRPAALKASVALAVAIGVVGTAADLPGVAIGGGLLWIFGVWVLLAAYRAVDWLEARLPGARALEASSAEAPSMADA